MHRSLPWLLALAACLSSCGPDASSPAARRPNVLLISLDSTRRDRLGCYGNRPPHAPGLSPSPQLDALAARGVRLLEAHAPTSWTLTSHISLFTGESPLVHAVEIDANTLPAELPTLPELLHAAGYRTAGFVSGPYLEASFGFGRGFDAYRTCYGDALAQAVAECARIGADWDAASAPGAGGASQELNDQRLAALDAVERLSLVDVSSQAVTDAALAELRSDAAADGPWFLFAHYYDPHYDYLPPAPHYTRFDPGYTGPIDGRDVLESPAISVADPSRPGHRRRSCTDRDLEHLLALYDGEVSWTDSQLGRLLQELATLGVERDTLVIVTADHGDEFFEHGDLGHRKNLCEEVLDVPLILAWPGHLPEGRAAGGLVSNTDLLPTLLELLGLPPRENLGGRSFAALAEGREDGAGRSVFARMVDLHVGQMAPIAGRPDARVKIREILVEEAFLTSTLKLVRERRWPRARPTATPELRQAAERITATERAKERLQWLDLGPAGIEDDAQRSSDFADPRAAAALTAWRALYAAEAPRRAHAPSSDRPAGLETQLGALGYVGGSAAEAGLTSADFVLPPPGELLPAGR